MEWLSMMRHVLFEVWRWLRDGRKPLIVTYPEMIGTALPLLELAAPLAAAPPTMPPGSVEPRRATPFWTASGVHGILGARRPALVAISTVAVEVVEPAQPLATAPREDAAAATLMTVADEPVALPAPRVDHHTLAHRLRQVRQANRPVRALPGLKRQARDVLARPAALAQPAKAATSPHPADDRAMPVIRTRPVLVYAA